MTSSRILKDNMTEDFKKRLANIKYIFTDLDGTMLTHGKATLASDGTPSCELIRTLCELKKEGIQVIGCSGRNRSMLFEDARILNLDGWIAEMGGILCMDNTSLPEWHYFTADMPYNEDTYATPHDEMCASGLLEEIIQTFPGEVETYHDNGIGFEYREVTIALRSSVDHATLQKMIDDKGLALEVSDNGYVRKISGETCLKCDRDNPQGVHTYHIMPKGLDKGIAVERFIQMKGWDKEQTLSAGDSPADIEMGKYTNLFFFMNNGLDHPEAIRGIESLENAYISNLPSTDGWVESMNTLIACKREYSK